MAAEKHDARKTTKTIPDIVSLHDVERTKSEEDTRARTETVITATVATNAMIANSGCQAILGGEGRHNDDDEERGDAGTTTGNVVRILGTRTSSSESHTGTK
jgi:hypothetical protein